MASDVGIVNSALSKLGQRPLLALTDNTNAGRLAIATYADLRDDLLRGHPWNFATVYTNLSASVDVPAWGFVRQFPLPESPYCLRVLEIDNPGDYPWKLIGRAIYTDLSSPLSISYIRRVTDANQMDANFREALAVHLAAQWCEKITGSNSLAQKLSQELDSKLRLARSFDGQEGGTDEEAVFSWVNARY